MRHYIVTFLLVPIAAGSLFGCASNEIDTVPVNDILTALKQQIAAVKSEYVIPAETTASCYASDHEVRVVAIPVSAVVDLKTVTTVADNVSGSANIPAGPSGVIVSPSIGASYSNIATTESTLNLNIQHNTPTASDLQTEISTLQKYISSDSTNIKDLKANGSVSAKDAIKELNASTKLVQARLIQDEIALASIESTQGPSPITGPTTFVIASLPEPTRGRIVQNLDITSALNTNITGILQTSHEKPCFLPQQLLIKVNFEVVSAVNGGVSVAFLVAKAGATSSKTDDATQSVTVTFDLSQGGEVTSGGSN